MAMPPQGRFEKRQKFAMFRLSPAQPILRQTTSGNACIDGADVPVKNLRFVDLLTRAEGAGSRQNNLAAKSRLKFILADLVTPA
jgi:hypothetical protein